MTEASGAGQDPRERRTHPVLAGYDGSEPSRHALAYAAGMARRLDRHLIVVHVAQTHVAAIGGCAFLPVGVLRGHGTDEQLRWLCRELADAADLTGLRVEVLARDGDPARELAGAAAENNADAIVIGAPSRLMHRFAGSVPAWLARHARCPVVIVP